MKIDLRTDANRSNPALLPAARGLPLERITLSHIRNLKAVQKQPKIIVTDGRRTRILKDMDGPAPRWA